MVAEILEAIGEAIRDWGIDVAREKGGVAAAAWFGIFLIVFGVIFFGLWIIRPDIGPIPLYVGIGSSLLGMGIRVMVAFWKRPSEKNDA